MNFFVFQQMHLNAPQITTLLFLSQVISFQLTECWSKEMTWKSTSHHWLESLTKSRKLQIRTPCYCLVGCQSVKGQLHSDWCCVSLHLHHNRTIRIVFHSGYRQNLQGFLSGFLWKRCVLLCTITKDCIFSNSCRSANSLVLLQLQNTISFSI